MTGVGAVGIGAVGIGAVILAAGSSSRMGSPKQILRFRGESLLRHVARAALDAGCFPVIVVTGTNGKTTTTRLIAHLFRQAGDVVGFTTTDGVYHQEHLLMEGDLTGPFAASVVLGDPRVEVAVLETARGGILRSGLGFDACDVGVVMNVSPDHLGMRGIHTVEQLADVKALIPASVKPGGRAVLNADDPLVLRMGDRTPGEVVLFSLDADHPPVAEHLAAGGTALVLEDEGGRETIVIRRGGERVPVMAAEEVPLTLGGDHALRDVGGGAVPGQVFAQIGAVASVEVHVGDGHAAAATDPDRQAPGLRADDLVPALRFGHSPDVRERLSSRPPCVAEPVRVGRQVAPGARRASRRRIAAQASAGFRGGVVASGAPWHAARHAKPAARRRSSPPRADRPRQRRAVRSHRRQASCPS